MTRKPRKRNTKAARIGAFLRSSVLDHAAEYARRGRAHAKKNDAELIQAWREAFVAMSFDFTSPEIRAIEQNLQSEMDLRKLQLPYDTEREAFDRFIAATETAIERLSADPVEFERVNQELEDDIQAFTEQKDKTQN